MFCALPASRMLAWISWRNAVLNKAASWEVSGGTSLVLVRPAAEAFAMTAMPQEYRFNDAERTRSIVLPNRPLPLTPNRLRRFELLRAYWSDYVGGDDIVTALQPCPYEKRIHGVLRARGRYVPGRALRRPFVGAGLRRLAPRCPPGSPRRRAGEWGARPASTQNSTDRVCLTTGGHSGASRRSPAPTNSKALQHAELMYFSTPP